LLGEKESESASLTKRIIHDYIYSKGFKEWNTPSLFFNYLGMEFFYDYPTKKMNIKIYYHGLKNKKKITI
jgi:hypothetical protein